MPLDRVWFSTSLSLTGQIISRESVLNRAYNFARVCPEPSSETQGQIVGTRESLNGRKNMTRRKVKNGEKSPWCQKNTSFLAPIRSQNGGDRWNWSGKTLSPGALLAVLYFSSFHIYFSARLDFPSPPLSAPGSPRMVLNRVYNFARVCPEQGI